MSDQEFHEIQLNGKQLVFLFMATTVVAVVIFLCGVMVGRGVPMAPASTTEMADQAGLDPTASAASVEGAVAVEAVSRTGRAPITAGETLTYPTLLDEPNPPAETLKPVVEPLPDLPAKAPAPVAVPQAASAKPPVAMTTPQATAVMPPVAVKVPQASAAKPTAAAVVQPPSPRVGVLVSPEPRGGGPAPSTPAASATAGAALPEPSGRGFVVQVAAVRERDQAEIIARRLTSKGYPAFVTISGLNFRVRVGEYDDRQEAEAVAGRLEREERFQPWVTR